jgi:hypothetical protein
MNSSFVLAVGPCLAHAAQNWWVLNLIFFAAILKLL